MENSLGPQQAVQANQDEAVGRFAKMQAIAFDIGEDGPQSSAGDRGGLVRPNHQSEFTAAIAPFFDSLVAPSDYQKALRLDCDLFCF